MNFSPKDDIAKIAIKKTSHFLYLELHKNALHCKKCKLHENRKHVVTGKGDIAADILLIGEAPGEEEDCTGIPFVGKAGQELDKAIEWLGLLKAGSYPNIYITNTICCRPPDNRNPLYEEEQMACYPRLLDMIYLIQPKLIVALGTAATKILSNHIIEESIKQWNQSGFKEPLKSFFDEIFNFTVDDFSCNLIITYHPSSWLRQKAFKTISIEHWKKIKSLIKEL